MPTDPNAIEAVAALDEPVRRSLYEWVVAAGRPVGRDEAAAGVGVSRALAAFHLDRLVREGLLTPEYRRLSGRTGPGAGRPATLYRRADREVTVSLPDRRYDVAARLLAEAVELMGDGPPPSELRSSAHRDGATVGRRARERAGPRPSRTRLREALVEALRDRGYEPRDLGADGIRLANCPFHSLVGDHRQLVCGMNLALADGVLAGLGTTDLETRLDPQPGQCCVAIDRAGR
jgi:predicted ArsR family transcriptional regulator